MKPVALRSFGSMLLTVVALALATPGTPAIIRVKWDSSTDGPGDSWVSAYRSISTAITACVAGDEVWVAGDAEHPYSEKVRLKSEVGLYGGFAGAETSRSERDWHVNATIIEGSAVRAPIGSAEFTVLDGFIVRNGPGGVDCTTASSPTITNNTFIGNQFYGINCAASAHPTISNNTILGSEDGIFCRSSAPLIKNNLISGSTEHGIYCLSSSPTISGNVISRHEVSAIYCDKSSPHISGNQISHNTLAGVACGDSSSPTISDNDISDNGQYGIYCTPSSVSPSIDNNIISRNARAGIHCQSASPPIRNNTISDNGYFGVYCDSVASTALLDCNAISGSKTGISCLYSSVTITNCVITENGTGIDCSYSSAAITNNTVSGNDIGIDCGWFCTAAITNTIVAFSQTGILRFTGGGPVLSHNCVYSPGGANYDGLSPGTADICDDPLFLNRAAGDFHITAGSACIDSGLLLAKLPPLDFDRQGRRFGGRADIGADEWWSATLSIPDAKGAPDGASIAGDGAVVTATWPDVFYVEDPRRSSGVRIERPGHGMAVGQSAAILGELATTAGGERVIIATQASGFSGSAIDPLILASRAVGGGPSPHYSAADKTGQQGMSRGLGLNSIGLLVTLAGKIVSIETDRRSFRIWDGSYWPGLPPTNTTGGAGVQVLMPGVAPAELSRGDFVTVTGVVSCYRSGQDLFPRLLVRSLADLRIYR